MRPIIGATLAHYRILSKLGEGGMGEVYLAEDTELHRKIALKVLPAEMATDPDRLERFKREARAVAALDHPNIVTIHSVEQTEGVHFLTMSLVEGKRLDEIIHSGGLPLERFFDLAIPLADAVAAAHAKGITHRDLKPANVMVTPEGRIKVLDFGLAKLAADPGSEDEETQALTQEGLVVGTVRYMSPEQAKGEPVDQRSDVFSLGVLLYEMATGSRPFQGKSSVELISSILKDHPEPVTQVREELPHHLGRLIQHCLEKDPERRFQTAIDLRNQLDDLEREVASGQVPISSVTEVAPPPSRNKLVRLGILAAVLLVAVLAGVWAWQSKAPPAPAGSENVTSLAVLPLENLSGDPEQEYFSAGMTESMITDLAGISALRVIARSSVMPYKSTTKSPREIGRELDVDALLAGSAMMIGDTVRVTAQLIETETEKHLWADSYQRDLTDILSLQRDLARKITDAIQITLTPAEAAALARTQPVDPESHRNYLRGRHALDKYTLEETRKALELFNEAIDLDPTAALPYAGLSSAYTQLKAFSLPPREVMPKARAAAVKALELDPDLADAHTALGIVKLEYDFDFAGAENALRRAIELNPNSALARVWLATHLVAANRPDEAISEIEIAQDLDPLSPAVAVNATFVYYLARHYEKAIEAGKESLELMPDHPMAHIFIGISYEMQGRFSEAIAELEKAREIGGEFSLALEFLTGVYAASGQSEKAREVLADFIELSKRQYVCAYEVATSHAALGDNDEALEWFEKGIEDRADCMPYARTDPKWDYIRDEPRFQELLQQIGPGG